MKVWQPDRPVTLDGFASALEGVTLFEELPGDCLASLVPRKKGKKRRSPTDPQEETETSASPGCQSPTSRPADSVTDAAVVSFETPGRKPKRRRRAAAKRGGAEGGGAGERACEDPTEVLRRTGLDMSSWEALHVPTVLTAALAEVGFQCPTEIQRLCLPAAIKGRRDVVGAAETGSGKTLAYALPLLYGIMKTRDRLLTDSPRAADLTEMSGEPSEDSQLEPTAVDSTEQLETGVAVSAEQLEPRAAAAGPLALILCPTRELALQVKQHVAAAARFTNIQVVAVVGGMSKQKQARLLSRRPDLLVATPGRLWELVESQHPYLSNLHLLRFLVVDETDRMVEQGHFEQLHLLLERINADPDTSALRQNFVFSATLTMSPSADWEGRGESAKKPNKKKLSADQKLKHIMFKIGVRPKNNKVVDVTRKAMTASRLTETALPCSIEGKDSLLYYFLLQHSGRTLIFCNSIDCVTRLGHLLTLLELAPLSLHANQQQRQRLRNLACFERCDTATLLATDVAARGLDIPGVQHVVHYQVPRTSQTYVHRSGRTARASAEGLSLMLVEPKEVPTYRKLMRQLSRECDLPPFDVNSDVLRSLTPHVTLARDINLSDHRLRRQQHGRQWRKRTAEAMELDTESSADSDEETERVAAERKHLRELKSRRRQLSDVLRHRAEVWAPRTQHGTLQVPSRNVSALKVAKQSGKRGHDDPSGGVSDLKKNKLTGETLVESSEVGRDPNAIDSTNTLTKYHGQSRVQKEDDDHKEGNDQKGNGDDSSSGDHVRFTTDAMTAGRSVLLQSGGGKKSSGSDVKKPTDISVKANTKRRNCRQRRKVRWFARPSRG